MADPIIIGTTTGAIIGNEKARNIVSGLFCLAGKNPAGARRRSQRA
jgi:hypothetical protein